MITVTMVRPKADNIVQTFNDLDTALAALELQSVHLNESVEVVLAEDNESGDVYTLVCDHCFEWELCYNASDDKHEGPMTYEGQEDYWEDIETLE